MLNFLLVVFDAHHQVDRLAAGLLSLGLRRGDRVGMWGPNMRAWVLTQFATAKAGLIQVPQASLMLLCVLVKSAHFNGFHHLLPFVLLMRSVLCQITSFQTSPTVVDLYVCFCAF